MEKLLKKFQSPSSEHRGAPFWAWNKKLEKDELLGQLNYFKEMGMGGFIMHSRTGMATEYLGEEFMDLVRACVKKAEEQDMKAYLYDEDRWPSGYAGGTITKTDEFRGRFIVLTPNPKEKESERENFLQNANGKEIIITDSSGIVRSKLSEKACLIAKYDIQIEDGYLTRYKKLSDQETGENVWYAYLDINADDSWFNNQAYLDTLNKEAVNAFIESTYEAYYTKVGEYFGNTIPAIFTDEPQLTHSSRLLYADSKEDLIIPYTIDFEESYFAKYQESFIDHLPEVFWDLEDEQVSPTRYRFHNHIATLFAESYSYTIGEWCRKHNIKLTGHMVGEPTLASQTKIIGDAMRNYLAFDVPGIDMLCNDYEYTSAKQAQSVAHQMGNNEIMSELYGVTNWDYDFRNHKLQGDWQAALGVTHRVPHLSWVSMAGEAKRDYPASIFYQSPWYKKYNALEDYYGRLNVALKQGSPNVKVGVIHPIESYWLFYGTDEKTGEMRNKLEKQFQQITEWLLFGLIDFDFISEALLEKLLVQVEGSQFRIGKMAYDTIIIPGNVTLRSKTLDYLKEFQLAGGNIIFMDQFPLYQDSLPLLAEKKKALEENFKLINFVQRDLMKEVEVNRIIDIHNSDGKRTDDFLYQLRQVNKDQILFIAHGKRMKNLDSVVQKKITIDISGSFKATLLNPLTGESSTLKVTSHDGKTTIDQLMYDQDSLLLYLSNMESSEVYSREGEEVVTRDDSKELKDSFIINKINDYSLEEDNVLMLDQAEYCLDGEDVYHQKEEILRIDNILRNQLGYPLKMDGSAQPWVEQEPIGNIHQLKLRYTFNSDLDFFGAKLAIEYPEKAKVTLNGHICTMEVNGFFVDKSIYLVDLPVIKKGENTLIVSMEYHHKSNLEWLYIIGDFGVEVLGSQAKIIELQKNLEFRSIHNQGFPFYGGNITYHCEIDVEQGSYVLEFPKYRAGLLSVALDGVEVGNVFLSPYQIDLGELHGKYTILITAYGNRFNTFGQVHLSDSHMKWFGPNSWRTNGDKFTYNYCLKEFGVLSAPILHKRA